MLRDNFIDFNGFMVEEMRVFRDYSWRELRNERILRQGLIEGWWWWEIVERDLFWSQRWVKLNLVFKGFSIELFCNGSSDHFNIFFYLLMFPFSLLIIDILLRSIFFKLFLDIINFISFFFYISFLLISRRLLRDFLCHLKI